MSAETYAWAADVANVRERTLPSGRAVERDDVRALFAACDDSPAGRRDAAKLAIPYGGGSRRAELCGLDLDDFDAGECVITVRAGKDRRDRVVKVRTVRQDEIRETGGLRAIVYELKDGTLER